MNNTAQAFQVAFYEKLSRQLRNKLVYHTNPIFVFGKKYHHYEHPTLGTYISIERLVRNTAVYKPKTHIKIISHSIPVLQNELEQIQSHLKIQDQLFGFTKDEQEIMKNLLDNRFDLLDASTESTEPSKMTGILSTPPPSPPVDPNLMNNTQPQLVINTQFPNFKIGALASAEPAYPRGNFATKAEYENYVNLQINGRTQAAIDYAAAMVAPHVHDPRNPFPHGHCYLLLFKPEQRVNIYQRGQDFLTKDILVNNSAHLDLKRRVMLHLQRATNDAHISMVKDPPDNDSIIVQVDFLSTKLLKAFDDSIVDFDELEEIFFSAPLVTRY